MQLRLAAVLGLAGTLRASSVTESREDGATSLTPIREAGRCAMYDSCGHKGYFGTELPCPDNELARKQRDPKFLSTLAAVCGPDFPTTTCCSLAQLDVLSSSLAQAEPLTATCPACRSNFRHFFCSFTCSPDQSLFIAVTATQSITNDGKTKEAVKSVDVDVGVEFGKGFYDSCKDVKFGATNGLAMDLLGGGAKNYLAFLRYMGQERALGSPFLIEYPAKPNSTGIPFHDTPLSCSSFDINARCACPDCPAVCADLPPIQSPAEEEASRCRVGRMSCFSFALVIVYAVLLIGSTVGLIVQETMRRKGKKGGVGLWRRLKESVAWPKERNGYDRVPMEDPSGLDEEEERTPSSGPTRMAKSRSSGSGSLVGATSTSQAYDGEDRPPSGSSTSTAASQRLGRGSSLLDPSSDPADNPFLQPRTYPLNTYLSNFFYRLGFFCASRPYLTLAIGFAVCAVINLGWKRFEVERDPVKLWVAKGSESEVAKNAFDNAFGPFYRTEQIFVSVAPAKNLQVEGEVDTNWAVVDEPVLSWKVLQWWASVEEDIRSLQSSPNNYSLSDVCFSPSTDPDPPTDSSSCVVQSIMGYFGDDVSGESKETWADTLNSCASMPALCLPGSQMPMNPKLLLGGIPVDEKDDATTHADEARALVVTYVVRNSLDPAVVARAEEWEWTLQAYLDDLASPSGRAAALGLELAYSTGISLEEELNKSTNTDVPIVVLSYLVMFAYVSINLGSSGAGLMKSAGRGILTMVRGISQVIQMMPVPVAVGGAGMGRGRSGSLTLSLGGSTSGSFRRQLLVESKFLLGLWGIIIVLLSVSTSVALFSALGVKVTLIIAEVIPFLVLAIGVDNVFILGHELDRQNARAYTTTARHGPFFGRNDDDDQDEDDSITSPEERVARALARMGPSILLSASCETVAFALGAMVGMPAVKNFAIYAAGAVVINALLQVTIFVSAMAIDLRRVESNRIDCFPCLKLSSAGSAERSASVSEGYIVRFIRTYYAPALLKKPVKLLVVAVFAGLFVLSWIGARHIELGLDQRLALPSDSYLVNYFNALDEFLDVGPPVYFVMQDVDVRKRKQQQEVSGRFSTSDPFSLANVLEAERKRPDSSFLAEPPAVWLDDYFQWLNPLLEDCCRVKKADPSVFCTGFSDPSCRPCYEGREPAWNITMNGLPESEEFMTYLRQWLKSPTDESCPLGGKASYSSALSLGDKSVELSHFRTYHTPLKSQADFINALAAAQRIADDLSERVGGKVFPYSLFYVFFDQYSHIVATTREVLTLALLAVFLVTAMFLGSWRTAGVVSLTVLSSVVMVMGIMGVAGISLNAISLVNLVISVGIAVEFCSHIARAFMGACDGGLPHDHPAGAKDRDERAVVALVDVGASVFSGITLTKLIGISVLALTRSKLLEVYFFRQWLALIVSGALHGLVFLPVALSFQGGQGHALESEDRAYLSNTISSRYEHGERPFLNDDDSSSVESEF